MSIRVVAFFDRVVLTFLCCVVSHCVALRCGAVTYTFVNNGTTYQYVNSFSGANASESNTNLAGSSPWAATHSVAFGGSAPSNTVFTVTSINTNPGYTTCTPANCTSMTMTFSPGCGASLLPSAASALFPAGSGVYTLYQNEHLTVAGGYTSAQSNCASVTVSPNSSAIHCCLPFSIICFVCCLMLVLRCFVIISCVLLHEPRYNVLVLGHVFRHDRYRRSGEWCGLVCCVFSQP